MNDSNVVPQPRRHGARLKRRVQGTIMVAGVLVAGTMAARNWSPEDSAPPVRHTLAERAEVERLIKELR